VVKDRGHPLEGMSMAGRVLVFSQGRGSTVGSYTLYRLSKNGKAPVAIINRECETIVAVGAIISGIPCVDKIAIDRIESGMEVEVDGDNGVVRLISD
jgi:predicted aconitase with swiveling domain